MSRTVEIIRGTALLAVFGVIMVWLGIRCLKKSEEPARLIFKWILTAGVIAILIFKVAPMVAEGGYGAAFGGIPFAAVCGLALAIIWRHNIAGMISRPFGDLYDGGSQEIEARPLYSMAMAKRKRGQYAEAIAEIWKQLERFPNDFEGQIMLAEIQADELKDLPAAQMSVERLCNQPGHAPRNIAFALNCVADWHLKLAQDPEGAKAALDKIIALFPDSELSALASQRIAHLADKEFLLAPHDRKRIAVVEGVKNLGLLDPKLHPKPEDPDAAQQAAELVKHLTAHPLDTEAREKLALIYGEHYGRLDLASDQLEQLISSPNQPAKRVVHWLNRLADLQIRHGAGYDPVRQTLQRIIDLFPDAASAHLAQNRLVHLKLELKGKEKGQTVKMGTYEQDIGLKPKR